MKGALTSCFATQALACLVDLSDFDLDLVRLAIYHLSMKPISRASGRSSVAAAAYRAAEKLTNERDGLTHDFTRRDGVEHVEIVVAQDSGADWAKDRSALWNAAEAAEKRGDARVAREFEIALPHELNTEQRLDLRGSRRGLPIAMGRRSISRSMRRTALRTCAITMRIS